MTHKLRKWLRLQIQIRLYTGVSVSGLSITSGFGIRTRWGDSVSGQNSGLAIRTNRQNVRIPRLTVGLGIRTPVPIQRNWVRIPRPLRSNIGMIKKLPKQIINTRFGRSEYGELRNLCKTSLASLEAEKRPLYCFWQLFNPRGLGIRTRVKKLTKTVKWLFLSF